MGKRSTARRLAMQALYQADVSASSIDEALKNVFEAEKFIPETEHFAENLARESWAARQENDAIINKLAIDWPLERISKVDLNILRLAIQELKSDQSPPSVVIDEAVELAKKYSSREAAKFINGILGSFIRDRQA